MDNPKDGMRVKIIQVGDTKGMLIKKHHLDVREIGKIGTLIGYVPGHGGDVWWVQHDTGTIGAYTINEFEEMKPTIQYATEEEKRKANIDFENRTITLPLLDNQYQSLKYDPTYQIYDFELLIRPKGKIEGK